MYAIYLTDTLSSQRGWFYRLRSTDKAEEPFKLVFSTNESNIKLWKSESAAIKYANTLVSRLRTMTCRSAMTYPYSYHMRWNIQVFNMDTQEVVHYIPAYKHREHVELVI